MARAVCSALWRSLVTPAWHQASSTVAINTHTTTRGCCTSANLSVNKADATCQWYQCLTPCGLCVGVLEAHVTLEHVCCLNPSFPTQALVTALCWRPDGKQLAAGHADGSISILDVETGDVVSENKVHYAGIASLQWSDQADPAAADAAHASTAFGGKSAGKQPQVPAGQLLAPQHSMLPQQRFKRLFAPPELTPLASNSTEALPDPYDMCIEATAAAAWPTERPGLSLLCAGDARGHVSLWLQGQVQIAEVAGGVPSSSSEGDEGSPADGPYHLVHVSCATAPCNLTFETAPSRTHWVCVVCECPSYLVRAEANALSMLPQACVTCITCIT